MLEYMFLESRKMRFNGGGVVCRCCYATGNVTSTESASQVGGFVGSIGAMGGGYISKCFATGDVEGYDSEVGGFAGGIFGVALDCYARGAVHVIVPD